jgi:hypothetical protein
MTPKKSEAIILGMSGVYHSSITTEIAIIAGSLMATGLYFPQIVSSHQDTRGWLIALGIFLDEDTVQNIEPSNLKSDELLSLGYLPALVNQLKSELSIIDRHSSIIKYTFSKELSDKEIIKGLQKTLVKELNKNRKDKISISFKTAEYLCETLLGLVSQ